MTKRVLTVILNWTVLMTVICFGFNVSVFAESKPGSFTVTASGFSTNENAIVNWTAASGANRYGLSVWKPPYGGDQDLIFDQYVYGTSQVLGKLAAGKYRVHMAAYNSAGLTLSNLMYFDVTVAPIQAPAPTPAPAPLPAPTPVPTLPPVSVIPPAPLVAPIIAPLPAPEIKAPIVSTTEIAKINTTANVRIKNRWTEKYVH